MKGGAKVKKRSMMIGSVILLVILLIGGGTFAWFSYSTRPVVNNFQAGTLKYSVYECFDGRMAQNVNPGDCFNKWVWFKNNGTKKMFIRAKITPEFEGGILPVDGVVKLTVPSGWVFKDGYYYYPRVILPGYSVQLLEKVCFDGPSMGNEYQGKKLTLTIMSEAIQATNGAPTALWGFDPGTLLTTRDVDISTLELPIAPEGLEFIEIGE